jgi:hypothetical protein
MEANDRGLLTVTSKNLPVGDEENHDSFVLGQRVPEFIKVM